MPLRAKDVVLSEAADRTLSTLASSTDPAEISIARRVRALRPRLLADCLHGEVVRQSAIPKVLAATYPLENLYIEDLPNFWRLPYTVARKDGEPFVVVIEIVEHRQYDKWFSGRVR